MEAFVQKQIRAKQELIKNYALNRENVKNTQREADLQLLSTLTGENE
jgi:hypothetical protein